MLKQLRNSVLIAATFVAVLFVTTPQRAEAQSYQIDCAILLCLSGGWPASVPCARARAEFIRRITPWPVEPPLQIWRCPMGAAYTVDPDVLTSDRIFDILFELEDQIPQQSFPTEPQGTPPSPIPLTDTIEPEPAVVRTTGRSARRVPDGFALQLIQDRADIDISGASFDFVRSIRVFNVTFASQRESGPDNDCNRSFSMRVGTYGMQGDFSWRGSSNHRELPEAHDGLENYPSNCPSIFHRSVFVEWRDYEGNYGFEQVNY